MPGNFSFVIPGKLAGCARPGGWNDIRSDLAGLARRGIGAVVSLTEDAPDPDALRDVGMRTLHLPVGDFGPPAPEQIEAFVKFVDACLDEGIAVAVHCGAGMGRTGTMLACYLVSLGMSARDAVRRVRNARPGSIETPEQESSVENYFHRLNRKRTSERGCRG